jgi:hypothetical protein
MPEKLDPEAKRLRNISPGELADAIGALEARVEVLKAEAIRRDLRRAEGEAYRIVLTPARHLATLRQAAVAEGAREPAGSSSRRSARARSSTIAQWRAPRAD